MEKIKHTSNWTEKKFKDLFCWWAACNHKLKFLFANNWWHTDWWQLPFFYIFPPEFEISQFMGILFNPKTVKSKIQGGIYSVNCLNLKMCLCKKFNKYYVWRWPTFPLSATPTKTLIWVLAEKKKLDAMLIMTDFSTSVCLLWI